MAPKKTDEMDTPTTTPEPAASPQVTLTFEQLKELLGSQASLTPDLLEAIMTRTADISARSMQKALKPENTSHPGISFGSYPEGDRAKPRPTLPFELLWRGFPVHREPELCTWWELEGYLTLKPGTYMVSRRDGQSVMKYTVEAQRGPDGTIERLSVDFEADRDSRNQLVPPYVACYQMAHADRSPRETFVEAMSSLLTIQLQDQQTKEKLTTAAA